MINKINKHKVEISQFEIYSKENEIPQYLHHKF